MTHITRLTSTKQTEQPPPATSSCTLSMKTVAAQLWAHVERKAFQCLYHPFVAGLAAGTLAQEDFQAYLVQDAYFLNAFAKAFAFAVTKTTASEHTLAVIRLMSGIEHELRTHSAFLESWGVDVFTVRNATAAPATLDYVNFLLTTAKRTESVAVILAAMAPCMRLYAFLGQQIAAAAKALPADRSSPYQRWIDSYSIAEFEAAAQATEDLLSDVAAHEGESFATLMPMYSQAMELELAFFEQYFPVARAVLQSPLSTIPFPITVALTVTEAAAVAQYQASESGHSTRHGIDIAAIESLKPGEYHVAIDLDTASQDFQVAIVTTECNPVTLEGTLPLLAVLLSPSTASNAAFTAQNKAEMAAFLKSLGARGSFAWFAHPITDTTASIISTVPRVLTIAGSDSGGGAGIQADMKACTNLGVFSTSAITAVTVQNTQGVHGIHAIPVNEIADQITCVLDDIGTDVVKTGMLFNEEIIDMVARVLGDRKLPLVVDPVMVSTSGHRLLKEAAHASMVKRLFPLATIITPNIPEASALLDDRVIDSVDEMKQAARDLAALGPAFVLVKGGHLVNPPHGLVHDVLLDVAQDTFHVITNRKLMTRNTHGTGCTLAAAIAAELAKSGDVVASVKSAIAYLHGVLVDSQALRIGAGTSGPMLHAA